MECRTDSEERLQGLEDEASDRQNPDQYPLDPPSRDEAKAAGAGLNSLFNLDDLGDISIQLITLVSLNHITQHFEAMKTVRFSLANGDESGVDLLIIL